MKKLSVVILLVLVAALGAGACNNITIDQDQNHHNNLPASPSPYPSPSGSPASGKSVSTERVDFYPFGPGCPDGVVGPPNRQVPYPLNHACRPSLTMTPFYTDGTKADPADTGAGDAQDEARGIAPARITFEVVDGVGRVTLAQGNPASGGNRYNVDVSVAAGASPGAVKVRATLVLPAQQGGRQVVAEWSAVVS